MPKHMTASGYARLRDKPKVWATRRIAAGMPAEKVGCEYHITPAAAINWEIQDAADRATRGHQSERERLASEQADHAALKNARERGQLIYSSQVAEILATLAADLAARHDAVAGRTASLFAGMSDPAAIRKAMLDEMREVRGTFANAINALSDRMGHG